MTGGRSIGVGVKMRSCLEICLRAKDRKDLLLKVFPIGKWLKVLGPGGQS